ncbi:CBS domain-containing protein [Egicoccus sp. AB-alg6-2]|uniref:CBS domain-containing protein n=1 Tax=Egicoccus sp. AB-alg6-2 TaxID=3242692 RepID=UPI00359F033F
MRTETITVASVVRSPIASIAPSATLEQAARRLAADELGLLVVLGPQGVRGVLSERDLVNAVAEGYDLGVERVADHAVTDVLGVAETATLGEAARVMHEAGIRHLLVTRHGTTVGVVSMRDVLEGLLTVAVV